MYKITGISLEYDIVTQPELARSIRSEYDKMVLLYDRVIQHSQIPVNKLDTKWNWSFNETCKSLKGILVLFEEEQPFAQDTSRYYNPKIQKVSVTVEGKPNQQYFQWMRLFEQYDEAHKYFAEGRLADKTQAQLQLHNVSVAEYLDNKYALWLDFRTIDENELHGTGRQIGNTSSGITIQVEKKAETAGALKAYIYLMYKSRGWIWNDPELILKEPGNQLYYLIKKYSNSLTGSKTLLLIDDIIADEALDKRHQPLLELAISGHHRKHSLWLLTQSYIAVPNNIRRQAKMLYVWYPKNRTDLNTIHEENDVIEMKEELARVRAELNWVSILV